MIHPAIGPYAVLSKLGEGGMGAVYRARDTKLNRDVALKVLLPAVANDPDRLARFSREAQVLASLNHPNIAAIFGLEDAGETKALVMELVEGEGLDEKIAAGVGKRESGVGSRTSGVGLPLDEALSIARQIAEALEAAHEQGIVHRDLKPANIKVRPDGTVKVLDFGLAKAMEPGVGNRESGVGETLAHSPTITTPAMTQAGMILGTAAYMSPEQAAGKPVDKRTDLWAFGVVLLEMLTGRRVFDGDTVSHVIAAVLKDEPDWAALPADTPAPIRKLLRRCLQKDRRQRLADAGDARLEIQDALAVPADEGTSAQQASVVSSPRGSRLAWTIAAAAAVLAAGLVVPALRYMRAVPPTPAPETRTDIVTPPAPTPNRSMSFALSPDGRQLVFVAADGDSSRLWLRPLGASGAQPLPGTEGASFPFWAPDSRSVAFFADLKLKRLDLGAGRPEVLAAVAGRGGAWLDGGVILFAGAGGGQIGAGLSRVSATGGEVSVATRLAPRQSTHRFPHALPGGQEFLFYARGSADAGGIYLGSLDAREPTRLTGGDSAGVYLPGQPGPDGSGVGGWLLWVNAGTLRAQSLDLTRRTLVGEPMTLATGVMFDPFTNVSALSVAHTGAIAYRSGQLAAERRQLTWFNRAGTELGTLGEPDQNELGDPTISPDGRRVAVNRQVQNQDIWVIDGARAVRFTFDEAEDRNPVWSPDGRHIVFSSARTGVYDLYSRPADGGGDEQRLVASDQSKRPWHWSPDGRFLLFGSVDAESGGDLWVLPLEGDRTPRVFHKTRFDESFARWSPDGRFVAYQSEESGQTEVYVRPFLDRATEAAGGGQWQVSAGGGIAPVWRPDGKELYYVARGGTLMAVAVRTSGAALEASAPVPLFRVAITARGNPLPGGRQYDVAPDGRFLISISNDASDTAAVPITLLQNWSRPTP